jgi:hypothetical protein
LSDYTRAAENYNMPRTSNFAGMKISQPRLALLCAWSPAFLILAAPSHAQQQDSSKVRASLLNAVFAERITYLDASERIDQCSLVRLVGDSSVMLHFVPHVQKLFMDREAGWCGMPAGRALPARMVTADSITVVGTDEREVFLQVYLGENFHTEQIRMLLVGGRWVMTKVESGVFIRIYRRLTIPPKTLM